MSQSSQPPYFKGGSKETEIRTTTDPEFVVQPDDVHDSHVRGGWTSAVLVPIC